jgi:hypothetical protein
MDGFKPIHQWHSQLSKDQIGAQSQGILNKASPVTNRIDNSELSGK